jgi:hypothetical protein
MSPFESAWLLLKMPVVDTNVPGVQMGYGDSHQETSIGLPPPDSGQIENMTPNDYFDFISANVPSAGKVGDAGQDYRWLGKTGYGEDFDKKHIQSMIGGLKSGQVMGMPFLGPSTQEGGHRMEALRQMGYGDTKVPVMRNGGM